MPGDEAALLPEPQAAGHAGDHHALRHQRAAAVEVALGGVGDLGLPDDLAGARIERHDVRVGGVQDDPVLVDRDAAVRPAAAPRGRKLPAILPQQVAGGGVERLHDVAGTGQEHHPVVHDRRGLLRPRLHRPGPDQTEIADVAAGDLLQRAVAPPVLRPAPVQPALRRRVGQQRVGDRTDGGRLTGRRRGIRLLLGLFERAEGGVEIGRDHVLHEPGRLFGREEGKVDGEVRVTVGEVVELGQHTPDGCVLRLVVSFLEKRQQPAEHLFIRNRQRPADDGEGHALPRAGRLPQQVEELLDQDVTLIADARPQRFEGVVPLRLALRVDHTADFILKLGNRDALGTLQPVAKPRVAPRRAGRPADKA